MGAIGAVGGVGGGLGSIGDSGGMSGGDAAPMMAPDPTTSFSQGWFNADAVMKTSGDVEGSTISLDDADYKAGAGDVKEEEPRFPPFAPEPVAAPQGVGDAPSAEVVDQVASVYAANRG